MKKILSVLSQIKLYFRLRASWRKARYFAKDRGIGKSAFHKVLIIPCDPWSVIGSRGDQAMIMAIQQRIAKDDPRAIIDILCENETITNKLAKYGFHTICR